MRLFIFFAFLLIGCGSEESKNLEKSDVELTRLSYDVMNEQVEVTGYFTTGQSYVNSPYYFVLSYSDQSAPEKCDSNSVVTKNLQNHIFFGEATHGRKYFMRGCVFNSQSGQYSSGITGACTVDLSNRADYECK
jgi:hypothetical protein